MPPPKAKPKQQADAQNPDARVRSTPRSSSRISLSETDVHSPARDEQQQQRIDVDEQDETVHRQLIDDDEQDERDHIHHAQTPSRTSGDDSPHDINDTTTRLRGNDSVDADDPCRWYEYNSRTGYPRLRVPKFLPSPDKMWETDNQRHQRRQAEWSKYLLSLPGTPDDSESTSEASEILNIEE